MTDPKPEGGVALLAGLEGTGAQQGEYSPLKKGRKEEEGRDEVRPLKDYPEETGLPQGEGKRGPGPQFPKCLEFIAYCGTSSVPRWDRGRALQAR